MNCEQAREEFSALLDGELSVDARAAVEAHLAECSECLRELDALKQVDLAYRKLDPKRAPAGFEERVRSSVRGNVVRFKRRAAPQRRVWPLLATAAVLLIMGGAWFVQMNRIEERFNVASVEEKAKMPRTAPETFPITLETAPKAPASAPAEKAVPGANEEVRQEAPPLTDQAKAGEEVSEAAKAGTDENMALDQTKGSPAKSAQPKRFKPKAVDNSQTEADVREQLEALGYLGLEKEKEQAIPVQKPEPASQTMSEKKTEEAEVPHVTASVPVEEPAKEESVSAAAPMPAPAPAAEALVPSRRELAPKSGLPPAPAPATAPAPAPEPGSVAGREAPAETYEGRIEADATAPSDSMSVQPPAPMSAPIHKADARAAGSAPPASVSPLTTTIGNRRFVLKSEIWCEEGYEGQRTTALLRDSKKLKNLVAKHPEIANFLKMDRRIIFSIDKKWYSVSPQEQKKSGN